MRRTAKIIVAGSLAALLAALAWHCATEPCPTPAGPAPIIGTAPWRDALRAHHEPAQCIRVPALRASAVTAGDRRQQVLTGRVVVGSGVPVAGARVHARFLPPHSGTASVSLGDAKATSGPDGSFRVTGIGAVELTLFLQVTHPAYAPRAERRELAGAQDEIALGDLALEFGGSASGQVRTADGAPLAGARVTLLPAMSSPLTWAPDPMACMAPAHTDRLGRYRFHHVLPGSYAVRVLAEDFQVGCAASDCVVDSNRETAVEAIALEPGQRVAGHVYDLRGAPIADAVVELRGEAGSGIFERIVTDRSGGFASHCHPAGEIAFAIEARGYCTERGTVARRDGHWRVFLAPEPRAD